MMKNYPLVSVIIPTYNSSSYIKNTLKKLEQQSYCNFEIVVVNDGSKDNTLEILEQEAISNQKLVIINKANGGVSSARNAGIKAAKGEFISFLDDDDQYDPAFLDKMYARHLETGANAIYCGLHRYQGRDTGTYKSIDSNFAEGLILLDFLNKKVKFHVGGIFLKREYVEEIGLYFDERLRLGEDLLFIYKLLTLCHVSSVPSYMYTHMFREDSLMNSKRTLNHYQHESYAHSLIYQAMEAVYQGEERHKVLQMLAEKMFHHKIRYMWKTLLYGDFNLLKQLVAENKDELSERSNLNNFDAKSMKKIKILKSGNILIWKAVRLINRKP